MLQTGNRPNGRTGSTRPRSGAADVRTTIPILSPEIVDATEQAIAQYSDIVARGGWPMVPTEQELKIGMRGPAVVALRQRLMITGDLAPTTAGNTDVFDSYVEAAVKRFQARHGIPVDGVDRQLDASRR